MIKIYFLHTLLIQKIKKKLWQQTHCIASRLTLHKRNLLVNDSCLWCRKAERQNQVRCQILHLAYARTLIIGGGDSLVHFYGIDYMRHSSTTRVYSNKINKESKDLASFLYVLWHIIELNTPNNKTCYSMFYSEKKKKSFIANQSTCRIRIVFINTFNWNNSPY